MLKNGLRLVKQFAHIRNLSSLLHTMCDTVQLMPIRFRWRGHCQVVKTLTIRVYGRRRPLDSEAHVGQYIIRWLASLQMIERVTEIILSSSNRTMNPYILLVVRCWSNNVHCMISYIHILYFAIHRNGVHCTIYYIYIVYFTIHRAIMSQDGKWTFTTTRNILASFRKITMAIETHMFMLYFAVLFPF